MSELKGSRGLPAHLKVHSELRDRPEYAKVLFGKLTPAEEMKVHWQHAGYLLLAWLSICLYYGSVIPLWGLCLLLSGLGFRYIDRQHASAHLPSRMPFVARILGFTPFFMGFMPLAGCHEDFRWEHIRGHHHSPTPLINSKRDRDTRWSQLAAWKTVLYFWLSPSHSGAWDIIRYQYISLRKASWQDRVATNLVHWAQLSLLFFLVGPRDFLIVLFSGHFVISTLFLMFHGLTHRVSLYRALVKWDPSGGRKIPVLDPLMTALIGRGFWLEFKWHDIHHTHGFYVSSLHAQHERGVPWKTIEKTCADLVDEGLLISKKGVPTSAVAEAEHRVGSRRAYLAVASPG